MFRSKVLFVHCLLFTCLCLSQVSNLQLLSSDFSKDIALQRLMFAVGEVKIVDSKIGCYEFILCHVMAYGVVLSLCVSIIVNIRQAN